MPTNRKWILTHTGMVNLDDLRGFRIGSEDTDVPPGAAPRIAYHINVTNRHNLSNTVDSTKLIHLGTIPKPEALCKPDNYAFRGDSGFQHAALEAALAVSWPKEILERAAAILERLANFISNPDIQVLDLRDVGPCFNIGSIAVSAGDDPTGEAEIRAMIE